MSEPLHALLLVDIQEGLDESEFWGDTRNNPQAEANCGRILEFFRVNKWPLYHIKHCSKNPESPLYPTKKGNAIKAMVAPQIGELVVEKDTNSAFIGTELENLLKHKGVRDIIVVGLTTDHCVSATVRTSADLGFKTTLVSDATATYSKTGMDGTVYDAELIHQTAIASLNGEFAEIIDTNGLLKRLQAQITSTYS